MDIKQKDRNTLKSYFVKNSIPTEANFADLIDGLLSVKDDGLTKPAGDPLSIEASGDENSQKKALNFYRTFSDEQPDWVLSLNPRSQANKANSARLGFGLSDGAGQQRLFIDLATGNLGVGTNSPQSKLSVAGTIRATENNNDGNYTEIGHGGSHAYLNTVGKGRLDFRHDGTNKMVLTDTGRLGLATDDPKDTLDINGKLIFNGKTTRRVYGDKRGNREAVVVTGQWNELEIKGRVIEWTGSNLHLGHETDHSDDSIYLGNHKLKSVAVRATDGLTISRPNNATTGGKKVFLELQQDDSNSRKVPSVYPNIRFHHGHRFWHRLEARESGFHFKDGDLSKDNYCAIRAKSIQTEGPQVAFSAYLTDNSQKGTKNPLALSTVQKNIGNAYSSRSCKFTAPIAGLYLFTMTALSNRDSAVYWYIMVNDKEANQGGNRADEGSERASLKSKSTNTTSSRTCLIQLKAKDQVWIKQTGGGCDNYRSGWEGVLIS